MAYVTLDVNETVEIPLQGQEDVPAEQQAAVVVRYPSWKQQRQLWRLIDEAAEIEKGKDPGRLDAVFAKLMEALKVIFVGTKNLGDITTVDRLDEVLQYGSAWALVVAANNRTSLSEKSRFFSNLRSSPGDGATVPATANAGSAPAVPSP